MDIAVFSQAPLLAFRRTAAGRSWGPTSALWGCVGSRLRTAVEFWLPGAGCPAAAQRKGAHPGHPGCPAPLPQQLLHILAHLCTIQQPLQQHLIACVDHGVPALKHRTQGHVSLGQGAVQGVGLVHWGSLSHTWSSLSRSSSWNLAVTSRCTQEVIHIGRDDKQLDRLCLVSKLIVQHTVAPTWDTAKALGPPSALQFTPTRVPCATLAPSFHCLKEEWLCSDPAWRGGQALITSHPASVTPQPWPLG